MKQRARALALLAAVTLTAGLTSCADDDTSAAPTATSTTKIIEQTTSTSLPSQQNTSTRAAVKLAGPGTVCDPNPQRKIVVNRGSVDCNQAIRIIEATPGMGEQAPPDIEGWKCGRVGGYGALQASGYMYRCDRGSDQVLQQDSTVPTANNWDLNSFFNATRGGDYFTTPSGKFSCAILGNTAGCHGPLPKDAPLVKANSGTQMVPPNTINTIDSGPGSLLRRGDPQFQLTEGEGATRTLAYGDTLFANGISCGVSEDTGVTCTNFATGHGFTVSSASFRLF